MPAQPKCPNLVDRRTNFSWVIRRKNWVGVCQNANGVCHQDADGLAPAVQASGATDDSSEAEDPLAEILRGHSFHGEAFNEGPRQKAYLMGGTGNIRFDVTTKSELAQKYINQGVGQLHGFWDLEAKAFIAYRVWQNSRDGVPIASYLGTDALLKQIYEIEPLHPPIIMSG